MLVSPELSTSMFTRLYYLEGHGLEHFKKVFEDREITQGELYVWKIDWEGGEKNVLEAIKPKKEVNKGYKVAVNYIGWLDDGKVFDSSIIDWKNESITKDTNFEGLQTRPLIFETGAGQVIPGFDEAIIGMELNEEKVVSIPPEKAYGTDPEAHLLGNKTLNFKLRVEKIV